ncbi:NAD(P)H-hydrate dehydratase [Virgibacillus litoralis]|uniref:Bifunctional NAD(P)H-hydrate repair enzyme n=1 Tax=Virgibacillus litoralis TaxID=578221 RepID=A0ABS4HI94_9BACI|nr:NAD(P)H-hydrate epimerase [Virgibacillus litoralis]
MFIVTANEMYDIDRYTMNEIGMDGKLLMENAGRAISGKIESIIEKPDHICILTGSGNNGGDGFVVARTLLNKGYHISVVQVVPNQKITGDALFHKNLLLSFGGTVIVSQQPSEVYELIRDSDVIVDAILGIGTSGMLRNPIAEIVSIINDTSNLVISVDIPSGLPADEGLRDFQSVQADYTVIVEAAKASAFLQHTASFYGKWDTVSIGLPLDALQNNIKRISWTEELFRQSMPKRETDAHKGNHGRGLVVGGNAEMPGSIAMTVRAALRAGAGLITAGTTEKVIPVAASHCMEATYLKLGETNGSLNDEISIPFKSFDAVALGMGMGRQQVTGNLVRQMVEEATCPLIVDADGLYHLKPLFDLVSNRKGPTIITPHPGEMAMLLDISVPELLVKPFAYSKVFAEKYHVYVVLKGKFTIVTTPSGKQSVNRTGNAGLAKGGSGDVLSGIILAMVMQKQSIFEALCNACFVHGKSADILVAEENSVYDLMASDVIDGIAEVYRTLEV